MNTPPISPRESFWRMAGVFLRLGLTAFGGPVAHLGYFHRCFVQRLRWLNESQYAELLALLGALLAVSNGATVGTETPVRSNS